MWLEEELMTLLTFFVKPRQLLRQIVSLGVLISTALMIWTSLVLFTQSESPIVVVLSGSMEPGYYRSDMLFLTLWSDPISAGDVTVYKLPGREIPIVHRVHRVHEGNLTGRLYVLTKGDNNRFDDRVMYDEGRTWLTTEHIMGRSSAYIPYIGTLTILVAENPWMKFVVVGLLCFFVLTSRETA